jgi:hypothetical protein
VAGSALGLGIAGLSVALLNGNNCGNGILGNILGGNCNRNCGGGGMETAALLTAMSAMNAPKSGGCSDLQAEIAQLRAEKYADGIVAQVYKANRDEKDALGDRLLEKYIEPISKEIADMRVREAQTGAAVDCLAKSTSMRFDNVYREIECAKKECGAAIALEGERRINGDNSIMCYVQGTYVPGKLVMPRDAICPEVMQRYNSWTAPTTPAPDTQAVTGSVQAQTN